MTGGGSDTVFATTNFALGTGQEVEFLRVAGAAGRVLTGNELANYLTAVSAAIRSVAARATTSSTARRGPTFWPGARATTPTSSTMPATR